MFLPLACGLILVIPNITWIDVRQYISKPSQNNERTLDRCIEIRFVGGDSISLENEEADEFYEKVCTPQTVQPVSGLVVPR